MLCITLTLFFMITVVHDCDGERRILHGQDVTQNKRYMVYLVQARPSVKNYDSWICGGTILNRWLVLTSAACVEDVRETYVIAGYDKYIRPESLFTDPCTNMTRRRVVFTCVPKEYTLEYEKVEKWAYVDIAIGKLEHPFIMEIDSWLKYCPYKPAPIKVNYDIEKINSNVQGIVLGWGHAAKWRLANDTQNLNQQTLQYATVSLINLEECKKYFKDPDLGDMIDKYMICSFHEGAEDSNGTKRVTNVRTASEVAGFCQNDHGGPLVAWLGNDTEPQVIGVASVFRIDKDNNCIGPFLYTSTAKTRVFIVCIFTEMGVLFPSEIAELQNVTKLCNKPASKRGFYIERRYMWSDPGGGHGGRLSENFNIQIRPQISMSNFRGT